MLTGVACEMWQFSSSGCRRWPIGLTDPRRVSSGVEQLSCKQQVVSSNLTLGSRFLTSEQGLCDPAPRPDRSERLVRDAEVPRLTSHGLRHTAASHMVRQANDLGELRAIADILGRRSAAYDGHYG